MVSKSTAYFFLFPFRWIQKGPTYILKHFFLFYGKVNKQKLSAIFIELMFLSLVNFRYATFFAFPQSFYYIRKPYM